MHQLPSQIVAKYEVLSLLGEGGMGAVYKVRHRLLDEVRVVKVIRPLHATDLRIQQRFRREAKAAIRLRHPNIAHIYDFGIGDDGQAHLEMELIEGVKFKGLLEPSVNERAPEEPDELAPDRTALDIDPAIELSLQALAALEYLHGQGCRTRAHPQLTELDVGTVVDSAILERLRRQLTESHRESYR